jgi:hypothetical protein
VQSGANPGAQTQKTAAKEKKKTRSAGSRQLTGNRDRSAETRSQQQKSGPDALGEEQAGPRGTNQTLIWVHLPQRKNTVNKKETWAAH